VFFLLLCFLHAKPMQTPTGELLNGRFRKILHRYRLSSTVQKNRSVVDHPKRNASRPSILVAILDKTYLAVITANSVSLDLNHDGIIQDIETARFVQKKDLWQAKITMERDYKGTPLTIQQVFVSTDLKKNLGLYTDMMRKGVFPNGDVFFLHSVAGRFDHPKARIVLDCDGDGIGDMQNALCVSYVAKNELSFGGKRWSFSVAPDGKHVSWNTLGRIKYEKGSSIPDTFGKDRKGKIQSIEKYRGRKVLLDFWATWCASCIQDHKRLKKMAADYDVQVLGFAQNTKRELKRYLRRQKLPWPQILVAAEDPLLTYFNVSSLPQYVLIDEKGRFLAMGSLKHIESVLLQ